MPNENIKPGSLRAQLAQELQGIQRVMTDAAPIEGQAKLPPGRYNVRITGVKSGKVKKEGQFQGQPTLTFKYTVVVGPLKGQSTTDFQMLADAEGMGRVKGRLKVLGFPHGTFDEVMDSLEQLVLQKVECEIEVDATQKGTYFINLVKRLNGPADAAAKATLEKEVAAEGIDDEEEETEEEEEEAEAEPTPPPPPVKKGKKTAAPAGNKPNLLDQLG